MDKDQLDDLKQLIETTAANTEVNLKKDLVEIVSNTEVSLKKELKIGRKEMKEGFAGVADAMEATNKLYDDRFEKVEGRLDVLEQAA